MIPLSRYLACLLVISSLATAVAKDWGRPQLEGDEFTKRFTASYGILSEKEPPLTELEVQILEKMAPMMRVNPKYAQTMLESMTVGDTPTSATFYYLLGNVYFDNEEYFLAEEQYKAAIEKFPDFQRAWTNLGILKLRSLDTRNALRALLKAIELGDTKPHTFGMLGYCHFKEGNLISAEVAYNRAMLSEPGNLDWLEGKAQVYLESERYPEAIRMQDELISRRPNDVDYWMAQTNAYLASDDLTRAARNLEIIRSMGTADFSSLFLLGGLYAKTGMHGPSADAYLAAAESAKTADLSLVAKAARQLLNIEQNDAAIRIHKTLQDNIETIDKETLFDYHIISGDIAVLDQDYAAAIRHYESAEAIDPMDGANLIRLAKLQAERGDRAKAYFILDRAENDPEQQYNALVARAKLLVEEKRFQESQPYISRALQLRSSESMQDLYRQVTQAAKGSN